MLANERVEEAARRYSNYQLPTTKNAIVSKMTTRPNRPLKIANTLGAFGYLAVCIQWAWLAVTQLLPFAADSDVKDLFIPSNPVTPVETTPTVLPDTVQLLLIIGAVIFSLLVTVYAVYLVPKTIGRSGKTITKAGAKAATDQLAKAKPLSKVAKQRLNIQITWGLKLLLIVLPLMALFIPVSDLIDLSDLQVMIVGLMLAAISFGWFALQATLSLAYKLRQKDVW